MESLRLFKTPFGSERKGRRQLMRALVALAGMGFSSVLCAGQATGPVLTPTVGGGGQGGGTSEASLASVGGLTDLPIVAGQTVHVLVFRAPDFSLTTRVSESGEIAMPLLGPVHIGGLNSEAAAAVIATELKKQGMMMDPHVSVTVDSSSSAITILGEVRTPGIYPPMAKSELSDVLAEAGGITARTGRVIEISNGQDPGKTVSVPWDPTMHNTSSYDRPVHPGDRIFVRACGFVYVGGNVHKPGAYSLCSSQHLTLSQVVAMAGGVSPMSAEKHTYLIRNAQDGTRVAEEIDLHKVLTAKLADPIVGEDDVIYVSPSTLKEVATRALGAAIALAGPVLYITQP